MGLEGLVGKYIFKYAILSLVLLLFGCDNLFQIGMGGEVDISPPSITLLSPTTGSYVQGSVSFAGELSDDQEVRTAQISFDRGSSWNNTEFTQESWSYNLDTTNIPDGRLSVMLRVSDSENKTTMSEESIFSIDNTAPVVLVTSPRDYHLLSLNTSMVLTVAATDRYPISSYTVNVQAATIPSGSDPDSIDPSTLEWEELSGYPLEIDQSASPLTHNFESSPFTVERDPQALHRFFRFSVCATDEAGNQSTVFYHSDDVARINNNQLLTVEQIAGVLLGNATGVSLTSTDIAAIQRVLDEDQIIIEFNEDTDIPRPGLTFPASDNPDSLPTMTSTDLLQGYFEDDDGIDTSSIRLQIQKAVNYDVNTATADDWSIPSGLDQWNEIDDYEINSEVGSRRIDWSFPVTGIGQGYFRLSLDVSDINGTSRETVYSRDFVVSDGKPQIEIDPPASQYFGDRVYLTGTASHSVPLSAVTIDIGYGPNSSPTWVFEDLPADYDSTTDTWEIDTDQLDPGIDLSSVTDGEVLVRAYARVGSEYEKRNVYLYKDTGNPSVSFDIPSAGAQLNTNAQISGAADDANSGIDNIQVLLSPESSPENPSSSNEWISHDTSASLASEGYEFGPSLAGWRFTFDTTAYSDENITLYLRARDRAGNSFTSSRTFEIYQDSDLPVVNLTNVDIEDADVDVLGGEPHLIGSVTDDDAVDPATFRYRIQPEGGSWGSWVYPDNLSGLDTTSRLDFNIPLYSDPGAQTYLVDGKYILQLWVEDTNGIGTSRTAPESGGALEFEIAVDSGPPTITITGPESGVLVNENFTIQGSVSDAYGIGVIEISRDGGVTYPVTLYEYVSGSTSTSETINYTGTTGSGGDYGDGTHNLRIRARDLSNNTVSENLTISIDTSAPAVTISQPDMSSEVNDIVTVSGSVNETGQMDAVYYFIDENGVAAPDYDVSDPVAEGWSEFSSTYTWSTDWDSYAAQNPDFTPKDFTIHVVARDLAGNWSTPVTRTVTVNQESDRPGVEFTNLDPSGTGLPSPLGTLPDNLLDANGTITGSVSDDDGIEGSDIQIDLQSYDWSGASWSSWSGYGSVDTAFTGTRTYGIWSHLDTTSLVEGVYRARVQVQDTGYTGTQSYKIFESNYVEFAVDHSAPNVTASAPSESGSGFSITGTSFDANNIASIEVTQQKDSGSTELIDVSGPSSSNDWANWTLDDLPRDPASIETQSVDTGTYVYEITATDNIGRTTSITRTVLVDVEDPTGVINNPSDNAYADPGNPVGYPDPNGLITNSSFTFSGTASDAHSSIALVEYNLNGSGWQTAAGTSSWSATVNTGALSEGVHEFNIRFTDSVGNESAALTRNFMYDASVPQVSLDQSSTRSESGSFSITGTASDGQEVTSIEISQQLDSGSQIPIDVSGPSGAETWSIDNLPRDPSSIGDYLLSDGVYTYRIVARDSADRISSEKTVTVTIDTTEPDSIDITSPALDQTGTNALSGAAYTLQGSASDSGVGMATLYYQITQNATASTTIGEYESLSVGNGNWSEVIDLKPGTGKGASGEIGEGSWYLHIIAEDAAGNRTPFASAVTRAFDVDHAAPALTEDDSNISGSSVVYRNLDISLGGTVTDGNGVSGITVTYSKDGAAPQPLTTALTGSDWSTNLETALGDGAYEVTITAEDIVGKTTSITRNIVIDTASPDLTITAPVINEQVDGSSYTIRGQVTDNSGKGVHLLEYSTTGDFTGEEVTIPLTGLNWEYSGVDFSGGLEGPRTLYVRASDNLNTETVESVTFSYDIGPPTLTETVIGTETQQITNTDITLSGDVSDTNALTDLRITATQDGVDQGEVFSTGSDGLWTFNHDLPGDGSDDGVWIYTLTATDVAGRQTVVTRQVLIDETLPDTPVISPFSDDYQVNALVTEGTASDSGSGLQRVEYSFNESDWYSASGTANWFKTIDISASGANLAQGDHTLYIRAVDRAENVSATGSAGFTVDREDPSLGINGYATTEYVNANFTIDGTVSDNLPLSGTPVSVTVEDPNGDPVDLTGYPLTYEASPDPDTWEQIVPIGIDGEHTLEITATDAVGRTTVETRTVIVDTAAPGITVSNIAADGSTQINSESYTVTGTSNDLSSGVALVEYQLNGGSWEAVTGTDNWTAALSSLTDALDQTIQVRATDYAGNTETLSVREFDVDTENPTLAVTGGNTGSSLVYRNTDIQINGTSTDANGVSSIIITYSKDGGSDIQILNDTNDDGVWSTTLALDPDGPDNIPGNGDDVDDGEYVFTITATDAVGKTAVITRSVRVDTENPSAEVTSLTPVIDTNTVNGKITVRAAVADGIALDYVQWALLQSDSSTTPVDGDYTTISGSKTSPIFNIDTTIGTNNVEVNSDVYSVTIADNSVSTLWIRAFDRAGNTYEIPQELSVDQDSDLPVISFSAIDTNADTPAESYLNLIESNAIIRFTLTDDDLVDVSSLRISLNDNSSWEVINWNEGTPPSDGVNISANHNLNLPTTIAEGTHHFYIEVYDEASEKDGLSPVRTEVGPIYIMADRNYPVVEETEINAESVFRSASYGLSGSMGDTNALSNITVTEITDGTTTQEVLNTNLSGTSDTWAITNMPSGGVADGEYVYEIEVTDASDKVTTLTRTVTIDTTAPEDPVVSDPAAGSWLNSSTYVFEGTASDGTGSGVETVYVTETARGGAAPAKGDPAWEEASVDGSGNWTGSVAIAAAGERSLHIYSVDEAGNDSNIATYNFGLDQAGPAPVVFGGSDTLYVNSDFTIEGTFTDVSGLSSISVETSTDNVTFTTVDPSTASFNNSTGDWSWDRVLGSQTEDTYYYRFTFTDLAGNSTQLTKTVNLDQQAPVVSFDSATPSINFDGGAQSATANGIMELSGTVNEDQGVANLDTLEYQIDSGGYSSLAVNGTFTIPNIDTTGIPGTGTMTVDLRATDKNGNQNTHQFTLNVDQSTDTPVLTISSPADLETINSTNVTVSGSITDDDGITGDPGTVQYRYSSDGTSGGYGGWQDVSVGGSSTSRSFTYQITSASDGNKLLEMRAYDVNGIVSASQEITINFDTDEPEITGLLPAEDSYFNADFDIEGTASDPGDVTLLRYRVEVDGIEEIPWTDIPGTSAPTVDFTGANAVTIDTSFGSGTYEIFLEASDGNHTREKSISVFVDKTDPVLDFDIEFPGSTQNNIIDITGTASDTYSSVQSIDFRIIDVNSGNAEMALPTGTPQNLTNWIIQDFDTRNSTLLSYAADNGDGTYDLTLRAIVTDLAGNTYSTAGGNDLVFTIDQSQDNPVVSFDDIATDGSSTITSTVITGNVTDDDGITDIIVETWDQGNTGPTPNDTETVELTRGAYGGTDLDWRIDLQSIDNGLRAIRVRVIDSVDNNGQDYSGTDYSRTDTGKIEFRLDTLDPTVAITSPNSVVTWSANNSFDFSGTSSDANGVTALEYKIDSNDFSSGTTVITGDLSNWSFTIPQGDLADGPHTIYVRATDSVNNTYVTSQQVVVDKTAPTIEVTSPVNGDTVFGPLTIGGTASDNSGGAGVDSISIGLGKQIDPGDLEGSTWVAVSGQTSWSFDFLNINDYANNTYSYNAEDANMNGVEDGGETWGDIWNFTFYVRVVDSAGEGAGGNIGYLTSYTLQIDPKQDRPNVTILSPDNGSTVGGYVRLFGSATDGQYIEKVQIAVDVNNNGDYTDDVWTEGGTPDETTDGINWYLANGTNSWNVNLNENGEFNPTGGDSTREITFMVRAKDYKENPGDGIYSAEVEYSVTFNVNYPQFSDVSLSSGQTVGGSETLTAIIRDETDLDRIVFSNKSPLLDSTTIYENPGSYTLPLTDTTVVQTTTNPYSGTDITVELIGENDSEGRYDVDYPGSYAVTIPIDTEAPGLYPNAAGSMSVELSAYDVTTPSAFSNQNLISFYVDNVAPSSLTYTGDTQILGTEAELQGTVEDLGTVRGIERVVVYMTNADGHLVRLQNSSGTENSFTVAQILDEENTAFDEYRMVIDRDVENGNDTPPTGDGDGIPEYLTLSAGTYNWSGIFDSNLVTDGQVTVHYIAEDHAGNQRTGQTNAFIANHAPSIDSIILGTDLNADSSITVNELTSPITTGYTSTDYTARNNNLLIGIDTSGGNGTVRYRVTQADESFEQTAVLNVSAGSFVIDEPYIIQEAGTTDFTAIGATDNTPGTVFIATGAGSGTGVASRFLEIDTTLWDDADSNGKSFTVHVFDSTTSDDADDTNELTDTITLNLNIDNIDDVPPSIGIAPFGQAYNDVDDDDAKTLEAVSEYTDNIELDGNSNLLGHVEYAADSLHDGLDADISGSVIFQGKVEDNQIVDRITATIPGYNSGTEFNIYTAAGGSLSNGTDWSFSIDGDEHFTDDHGNVFNWDFQWNSATITNTAVNNLTITFTVYDASGTNSATDTIDVDIVPYITDIVTRLSSVNQNEPSVFSRSALGRYPVASGEEVIINGFNLSTATDSVLINGIPKSPTSGTRTSITVNVGTDTSSGPISVTTNFIESINNINDNSVSYNQEPNNINNNLLVDDRGLYIWDFGDLISSASLTSPRFTMDEASNYYLSYGNNSNRMYLNNNGSVQQYDQTYNSFHHTIVGYDLSGNIYGASSNTDRISNTVNGATSYTFYSRTPGNNATGNTAGYSNGTNKRRLELAYNGSTGVYDINRVEFPDMSIHGSGTDADPAEVCMIYYDANSVNDEVKFRYGEIGNNADTISGSLGNNLSNNNPGSATGFQVIADSTSTYPGGEFVAVDATSTGVAVVAWYDSHNRRLIYSYNTNPSGASEAQWQSNAQVIDDDFAGWYVDVAVDGADGVHIAYYNSSSGDLKYAYLSSYDAATEPVVVDSYLSTGTQLTIDTRLEGANYVPYISYYQPSFNSTTNSIRVAWQTDFSSLSDGATNDFFTGKWEIMTLPTNNIPVDGRVGLGVPTSGTYADSIYLGYYTDVSFERVYLK